MYLVDHDKLAINVILKLKSIFSASFHLDFSLSLFEVVENLIEIVCQTLKCARASLFLIDNVTNELYTKVAKDSTIIRIPIGKGIAGHVAKT